MVAAEFARFLGLPVMTRANITDIIEAVCGIAVDARVSVVCVDEVHNISLATKAGAEVSDALKYFSERIPATFVYAGIDVGRAGFCLITSHPFPPNTEWDGVIATLE